MKLTSLNRVIAKRTLASSGLAALLVSAASLSWAADPTPAAPAAPKNPEPTLEQRVGSLEAYVTNGDPTASLKDKDGKIPDGLATPTSATAGPGHNGWMMTTAEAG